MELTKKQQFWKAHLDALELFEGSAADYARLHDLEVKKLYVYKTAIRERLATQEVTHSAGDGVDQIGDGCHGRDGLVTQRRTSFAVES
jgi:hypothetical protein